MSLNMSGIVSVILAPVGPGSVGRATDFNSVGRRFDLPRGSPLSAIACQIELRTFAFQFLREITTGVAVLRVGSHIHHLT